MLGLGLGLVSVMGDRVDDTGRGNTVGFTIKCNADVV